jgi:hypothetical protein
MSEIFPDEGLDLILSYFPKGTVPPTTLYMGLFTSQTPTTVPASTAVLATSTGVTEASGTSYARQSIANTSWGAPAAGTGGRKSTAGQVTFPAAGSAWGTVNGFFIADSLAAGKAFFYANFDDGLAIIVGTGDIIKITPTGQFNS